MLPSHCDYHIPFNKMTRRAPRRFKHLHEVAALVVLYSSHSNKHTVIQMGTFHSPAEAESRLVGKSPANIASHHSSGWMGAKVYYGCAQLDLQPSLDKLY